MEKEKVLEFLDLDTGKTVDKFSMKLVTWFNLSFGLFVILASVLLGGAGRLDLSLSNILFIFFCLITNILFFMFIRSVQNSAQEWIHCFIVLLCSVFTLLYGWFKISMFESAFYEHLKMFTWIHVAVLATSLILSGSVILRFVWVLKLLKDNTVEEVKKIISSNFHRSGAIVASISPIVLVRVFKGPFHNMGLGVGFGLWGLMCIWLFLLFMILPRMFVIFKYKLHKRF